MRTANRPIRVAVLGGGCGAMTAAFYLTSTEALRRRFEVTVYQQGWRLGGKGASGRNGAAAQRIEEHGIHMWMGFYDNAFRMIREVYAAWEPGPRSPIKTWRDAFGEQFLVTLQESLAGGWDTWNLRFPPMPGVPGDPRPPERVRLLEYVRALARWIAGHVDELVGHQAASASTGSGLLGLVSQVIEAGQGVLHSLLGEAPSAGLREALAGDARALGAALLGPTEALQARLDDLPDELRRLVLLARLGLAMLRGLLVDVLPYGSAGFARIDGLDFKAWLREHGARDESVYWSAPVRAFYDLTFAYEGGVASVASARVAAGAAMKTLMRIVFGYRGAPLWRMHAGMGDVVFAPIYEVLRARGVRFEYFRRVRRLGVMAGANVIEEIELDVQAELNGKQYDPLIDVKGLRCWPNQPRWDQVKDGAALAAAGVDFESAWCDVRVGRETLVYGRDFDAVVLGVAVGGLKPLTSALAERSPRWRAMLEHSATVATRAVQLWLKPTTAQLGWTAGATVQTSYAPTLSSWADMSDVLPREAWPADHQPGSLAYLCDVLDEPPPDPPDPDPSYPARVRQRVEREAAAWLRRYPAHMWPSGAPPDDPGGLDLSLLESVSGGTGAQRLASQYYRANIDPSERYVLTLPGSTVYRMAPGDTDFSNLVIAGDWTLSSINGGSVEAAVESGVLAARGLGVDVPIVESLGD
jgi:uncharacterized protein with NAD-binding domain and iron-sulfur cluster